MVKYWAGLLRLGVLWSLCVLLTAGCTEHVVNQNLGALSGIVFLTDDYGAVLDSIPAVSITVEPGGSTTMATANGRYLIEGIPEGVHTLRLEAVGYGYQLLQVQTIADSTYVPNVTLHPVAEFTIDSVWFTSPGSSTVSQNLAGYIKEKDSTQEYDPAYIRQIAVFVSDSPERPVVYGKQTLVGEFAVRYGGVFGFSYFFNRNPSTGDYKIDGRNPTGTKVYLHLCPVVQLNWMLDVTTGQYVFTNLNLANSRVVELIAP